MPAKALPSGQRYKAEFALSALRQVPKKFETFTFSFQTIEQSFVSEIEGLSPYTIADLSWQQLEGKVRTADVAETSKVEEMLTARQNGRTLNATWKHNAKGTLHFFTIDSVQRKDQADKLVLEFNGKPIEAEGTQTQKVEIPALGDFKIMQVKIVQQPTQYISIRFSDPLDASQELLGLVRLNNGSHMRFHIQGNELKAYPYQRQKGSAKLIIHEGLKNSQGYRLNREITTSIRFESLKPKVAFLGKGSILPNTSGLILPFKAVNLRAVHVRIVKVFEDNIAQFFQVNHLDGHEELKRVGRIVYEDDITLTSSKPIDYGQWNTFSLDLAELIKTEPGAIYQVQLNFDQSQSLYPCNEETQEEAPEFKPLATEQENESDIRYLHWRGFDYYEYDDEYNWRERENPCKASYYLRYNQAIEKNILATNLGIIAKKGANNQLHVIVSNLVTATPESGVEVTAYNFQQQEMGKGTTDNNGMVTLSLSGKPYLLKAQKATDNGYLRIDEGSALSLSMFNVGGKQHPKGLKGYLYGERGVWRPGDSLFLGFFLDDSQHPIPDNHPVVMELYNPMGQLTDRKVRSNSVQGLYDFRTATPADAPTGNWMARVKVGGATFSKELKIETIKPNRLKMNLTFEKELLTSANTSPKANLEVNWLHGAPGANLRTEVNMKMMPAPTTFENFPDFLFDDQARSFQTSEKTVFDQQVDAAGKAVFTPHIEAHNTPGMVRAAFRIRAFEKSGEFSIGQTSVRYSPYSHYVGIKIPEGKGWNGALMSDRAHQIPLVTVTEQGDKASRKLQVEVFKIHWRWWWEHRNQDDLARYVNHEEKNRIQSFTTTTRSGEGKFELKLDEKYWGRLYVRVTDPNSGHSTGKVVYMDYPGWWDQQGGNAPGGATMLTFTTDKDTYQAGEKATLTIPGSDGSRALVSIENGSSVLQKEWVETHDGTTQYSFTISPEMAPNAYVHITLIQPHNQTSNDRPIRLYGVQPIQVEDPQTILKPEIDMPDVLAPEEEVTITVSEENGKAMAYTLAVVDDGLLDLTNFATPNAWNEFFARQGLGVRTWDLFDYVMGAFSGELAGLYEIGGGEFTDDKGKKEANRFKPVVEFIGPFYLKKGKKASHTFKMPNYVGSVRTMIVAGAKGAYGAEEKTTPVKKPLMTLATVPRVVGPGEEIAVPVTVFAMDQKIERVQVEVTTNAMLRPMEGSEKELHFTQPGDQTIVFRYKVPEKLGVAKLSVEATSGREKARWEVELQVRAPNPPITRVVERVLKEGENWTPEYQAPGMPGTNEVTLEVSQFIPINLQERLDFLIRYPHGCIEQSTSAAFPQLYLHRFVDLSDTRKEEIAKNVKATIKRIRSFQQYSGGFSYWPGAGREPSYWGTNYAGHFLIEAEKAGYQVPGSLLSSWTDYQQSEARQWQRAMQHESVRSRRASELTQAYRLYTLALAGKPSMGAMNRMREYKDLSMQAQWRLAAAYKVAGKDKQAAELIENLTTEVQPYNELGYTYGSDLRDQAMILATLSKMDKEEQAFRLARSLGEKLASSRWYSTQSTAYGLLAMAQYLEAFHADQTMQFAITLPGERKEKIKSDLPVTLFPVKAESGSVQVENNGKSTLYSRLVMKGIPVAGNEKTASNDLFLSVRYLNSNGEAMSVQKVTQGTDIIIEATVKHPGVRDPYQEMVLTHMVPAGWEIRNQRMNTYNLPAKSDEPEYQDIRDDRVYSYFDLRKGESKTFRIVVNAAYVGKYYLPALVCEAMYDNSIQSVIAGQWVEVIPVNQ
ncbi:MAG: alpha-2-macroglobulin family protein [Bacteroidota bacterium]